jgi:hypothetical protein
MIALVLLVLAPVLRLRQVGTRALLAGACVAWAWQLARFGIV